MKHMNLMGIRVDESGRVELSDDTLLQIEQSFIPTAAGTDNTTTCNGTNASCNNTGDCSLAKNTTRCSNVSACIINQQQ